MIDGVAVTSALGSFSALTTLGNGRNSPHSVILAQPGINPITPAFEHAAESAAIVARYGAQDPARPFQTLRLTHSQPPAESDRFTYLERNQLLFEGIGTTKVGPGGQVELERPITTYQLNAAGAPDVAYLDVNTPLTILYLRYSWRSQLTTRYPRHKLADDGARFGDGQAIMTPKQGKAEALAWYEDMIELGLVEAGSLEAFKAALQVERNVLDVNRLDWRLTPDLVNQAIIMATLMAFKL
jgi:phage tail sheath gpL-like